LTWLFSQEKYITDGIVCDFRCSGVVYLLSSGGLKY